MRILLFVFSICISCTAMTQEPKLKPTPDKQPKNEVFSLPAPKVKMNTLIPDKNASGLSLNNRQTATFSHALPNGNKVYLLPQDNMPCVVPDLTGFNMPNGKINSSMRWNMPNASPQIQLIPQKSTPKNNIKNNTTAEGNN